MNLKHYLHKNKNGANKVIVEEDN
jgi:hypothetical protein